MPNKIKPKRSYTTNSVPLTTDLDTHELAINWADGKAFTKNAAGQIVTVTLGGSGGGSGEDTLLRSFFLPPAPTSVSATSGNGQAIVTWTAPTVIAQIPITDYIIQYSSNSGATWTTFPDGTSSAATATVTGLTNGTAYVFRVAGVNGVGTGTYSSASNSVTPAAGDLYWSSVRLLLHCNGANNSTTFTDASSSPKTVTANGDAKVSTAQSKFGGAAAYFDGSGDYLSFGTADLSIGTSDFALEMFIYPTSNQTAFQADWRLSGNAGPSFYMVNGQLNFYDGGSLNLAASGAISANVWSHIAVSRSSGVVRIYQNGTLVGTQTMNTNMGGSGNFIIGWAGGSNPYFSGYIDEVRLTIGSARGYTGSTIDVPTAQFPDG